MQRIRLIRDSMDHDVVHAYTSFPLKGYKEYRLMHAGTMHIDAVGDFFGAEVDNEFSEWDDVTVEVEAKPVDAS